MHPVLNSFKRVYLRSVYLVARFIREYGLTPARFDMMTAIGESGRVIAQSVVRRVLAVSANVVSRMLRSLEKLGLVKRVPHPQDRRTRHISLTYRGTEALHEAQEDWLGGCQAEHFTRHIIAPYPELEGSARHALRRTQRLMHAFRDRLGDTSSLVYPCYTPFGERSPEHPLPMLPRHYRAKLRVVPVDGIPRLRRRDETPAHRV